MREKNYNSTSGNDVKILLLNSQGGIFLYRLLVKNICAHVSKKKHDPNCRLSKIFHSCLYITTGTTIFNTFLCYFLFNKEIERDSIQNVLFVTLSEIVVFRKKLKFSFVFIDEILFENKNYTGWY